MSLQVHSRNLSKNDLEDIATSTIGHYDDNAEGFWLGTKDHDVSQNREALLRNIKVEPPLSLLDLGCGPGRDLAAFKNMGHEPVGLDGSARFCEMAAQTGCEILHQNMLEMQLPAGRYHGIFANASLFHVPTQELPGVLRKLHAALQPHGVLFVSNPRGNNQEGFGERDVRYGAYWDETQWREMVGHAGFEELEHYYRPPGKPRNQQPWLATVWRKQE
ncbi:hypothetical protein CYMTET_28162 [Cymbomonas tetramitiformis]|uniref:Methyltransferase domain-containing protein n=1 Tax=Cymbomonas tetramitiformis TaxID=36881 RepID=A0AAE0KW69_9CHLO|nr:hypothetical protein CYMTET_28162 [Cymbomonas tetramitiformis]